jgi:RNA polymerase sigma factor (sigma-70 family)
MSISDTALLERWAGQHDAEALAELAGRHSSMVYAACMRILYNDAEAQDAAQDCFVNLLQFVAGGGKIESSLGGWLHTTATRHALNHLKTNQRRQSREEKYALATSNSEKVSGIDDLQRYVDEAIASLPPKLRDPVVSHFLEGQSHQMIAGESGIPRRTVTSRISKGIEEVRKALKRRGVSITTSALASLFTVEAAQATPASLTAALGKLALGEVVLSGTASVSSTIGTMSALSVAGGIMTTKTSISLSAVAIAGLIALLVVLLRGGVPKENTGEVAQKSRHVNERLMPEADLEMLEETESEDATTMAPRSDSPVEPLSTVGKIVGRVRDTDTGMGIPGARVHAFSDGFRSRKTSEPTRSSGQFEISGLCAGRHVLETGIVEGYPRMRTKERKVVVVKTGEVIDSVDFFFTKGIGIAGLVVDSLGVPVEGARIAAEPPVQSMHEYRRETATSGEGGAFAVFGFEVKSDFIIQAASESSSSEVLGPMIQTARGVDGIVLTLVVGNCRIEGKVVNRSGVGLENVGVATQSDASVRLFGGQTRLSDKEGLFRIEGLKAGQHQIRFTFPGSGDYSERGPNVLLREGENITGIRLVLGGDGPVIAGTVRGAEGRPLQNASVLCEGPVRTRTFSGKDGLFLLSGLVEGVYALTVDHRDYSRVSVADIPAGSEELEIALPQGAEVEGTVVDARNGHPITEFAVGYLVGRHDQSYQALSDQIQHVRDDMGRFAIGAIDPGDITIFARADGYASGLYVVEEIVTGESVSGVKISLVPGNTVTGRVSTGAGQAIQNAAIYVGTSPSESSMAQPWVYTLADGSFTLEALPPEPARIHVAHPGFAPAFADITPASRKRVQLVLHVAGVIEGAVTNAGRPVSGGHVQAIVSNGGRQSWSTDILADGTYRLDGLPAGYFMVRATIEPEFNPQAKRLNLSRNAFVDEGKDTIVNMDGAISNSTLKGTVTEQGNPVPEARVLCSVESVNGSQALATETDMSGDYQFDNVPVGVATLAITITPVDRPRRTKTVRFEVTDDELVRQDVDFSSGLSVTGHVINLAASEQAIVLACPGSLSGIMSLSAEEWAATATECAIATSEVSEGGGFVIDIPTPGIFTLVGVAIEKSGISSVQIMRVGFLELDIQERATLSAEIHLQ